MHYQAIDGARVEKIITFMHICMKKAFSKRGNRVNGY